MTTLSIGSLEFTVEPIDAGLHGRVYHLSLFNGDVRFYVTPQDFESLVEAESSLKRASERAASDAAEIRRLTAERDEYRARLADLLAATNDIEPTQSTIYYRGLARDLLKNGPSIACRGCSEAGGAGLPIYHAPPECTTHPTPEGER